MMAEPLAAAIQAARKAAPTQAKVVYLSPQGRQFNQQVAEEFFEAKSIILLAGRYEGIDERILATEIDEEWSIGDYILSAASWLPWS